MHSAEFLAMAEHLPFATIETLSGGGGLVVIAPHPDDESLGCGGVVAAACRDGVPIRVVVLSDGVGSHPNSATYPAVSLRALREEETRRAVGALGLPPDRVRFLGLPDRFVPTAGRDADLAVESIAEAARACRAGALLVTWEHDPHCDHAAAHALARRACRDLDGVEVLSYPVWGWTLPPDTEVGDLPSGFRFDATAFRDAKARAIAAHASQVTDLIGDDPHGFRLPPEMIADCLARPEIFLRQDGRIR